MDIKKFIDKNATDASIDKDALLDIAWKDILFKIETDRKTFIDLESSEAIDVYIEYLLQCLEIEDSSIELELFAYFTSFSVMNDSVKENLFKKYNYGEKEEAFFITRKQFIQLVDQLNKSPNVQLRYTLVWDLLREHFFYKFLDYILKKKNLIEKKKSGAFYNNFHNQFYDLMRARKYAEGKSSEKAESPLSSAFKRIMNIEKSIDSIPMILDSLQGKTEKNYIKKIIQDCTYYKGSKNEFYKTIFQFIHSVLPDSKLLSIDEFLSSKNHSQAYNADYSRYQYITVASMLRFSKK